MKKKKVKNNIVNKDKNNKNNKINKINKMKTDEIIIK